eukprot:scaffold44790_cov70-Phaeocystis_antarctica.AAC.2
MRVRDAVSMQVAGHALQNMIALVWAASGRITDAMKWSSFAKAFCSSSAEAKEPLSGSSPASSVPNNACASTLLTMYSLWPCDLSRSMTSFGRGISSASSIFCIDASLLAISSACELVRNSSRLRPVCSPTPFSSSVIWNIVRALIICSSSLPMVSSSTTVEAPSLCLLSSCAIALRVSSSGLCAAPTSCASARLTDFKAFTDGGCCVRSDPADTAGLAGPCSVLAGEPNHEAMRSARVSRAVVAGALLVVRVVYSCRVPA